MNTPLPSHLRLVAIGAALAALASCHRADAPADPAPAASAAEPASAAKDAGKDAGKDADEAGVKLTEEQEQKLGVETSPAVATSHAPEAEGYAMVVAHETIAQAVAELATAQAAERQTRTALARIEHLAGTAGAMPADAQEAAARQAAVDAAALALAQQRLSAAVGRQPPWPKDDTAQLAALANGETKLVRVTFPMGQLGQGTPRSIGLTHLDAGRTGKRWPAGTVWEAPADAGIPGRSYFAILKGSDASEGERLLASAPVGASVAGVLVPDSAVVISDNKYWCYVEGKDGMFTRVEINTREPIAGGYFVREGISPGDPIVTAAAGQLLARETNASAGAED